MKRKVLIIGGTSGLGRKLAELYCKENCIVGIIGRREKLLTDFANQFPENSKICRADISENNIEEKIESLITLLGGFDVFIFCASVIRFNPDLNITDETDTIAANITGFTKAINIAYNYCKKNNTGQIVVVTSVAAARGNKVAPAYNASKTYQSKYAEGIRVKLKSEKIDASVTEIVPGYMDTAMAKGTRLFWVASLEKAGRQTKKAIERKKRIAYITHRWWLIYQVYRFMPSFLYDRIMNSKISLQKK